MPSHATAIMKTITNSAILTSVKPNGDQAVTDKPGKVIAEEGDNISQVFSSFMAQSEEEISKDLADAPKGEADVLSKVEPEEQAEAEAEAQPNTETKDQENIDTDEVKVSPQRIQQEKVSPLTDETFEAIDRKNIAPPALSSMPENDKIIDGVENPPVASISEESVTPKPVLYSPAELVFSANSPNAAIPKQTKIEKNTAAEPIVKNNIITKNAAKAPTSPMESMIIDPHAEPQKAAASVTEPNATEPIKKLQDKENHPMAVLSVKKAPVNNGQVFPEAKIAPAPISQRNETVAPDEISLGKGQVDQMSGSPPADPTLQIRSETSNFQMEPPRPLHAKPLVPIIEPSASIFELNKMGINPTWDEDIDLSHEIQLSTQKNPSVSATSKLHATTPVFPPIKEQLIGSIQAQIHSDKAIKISLNPAELGRLKLSITPAEQGIVVNVLAERADVLDVIRRNITDLEQAFATLGHENMTFMFEQGNDFSDSDTPNEERAQTNPNLATNPEIHELPTEAPATEYRLNASSGVDIRV